MKKKSLLIKVLTFGVILSIFDCIVEITSIHVIDIIIRS